MQCSHARERADVSDGVSWVLHSDMWAAYRRVQHLPPVDVHNTESLPQFVDPVTGVHTQNWKGCHAYQLRELPQSVNVA